MALPGCQRPRAPDGWQNGAPWAMSSEAPSGRRRLGLKTRPLGGVICVLKTPWGCCFLCCFEASNGGVFVEQIQDSCPEFGFSLSPSHVSSLIFSMKVFEQLRTIEERIAQTIYYTEEWHGRRHGQKQPWQEHEHLRICSFVPKLYASLTFFIDYSDTIFSRWICTCSTRPHHTYP